MTGSGTAVDPYIIWDVNDLQAVGNGAPYSAWDFYRLGADIDASATATWNWDAGRGVFQGFAPLPQFWGDFDGMYKAITGLHIDRFSAVAGAAHNMALFDTLTDANVRNLLLLNVDIYAHAQGINVGVHVAPLAARLTGAPNISRVLTTGTVRGLGHDTGGVGDVMSYAGGLFAFSTALGGVVSECCSYVDVEGIVAGESLFLIGGLWGQIAGGGADDCYARGAVSGTCAGIPGGAGGFQHSGATRRAYSTGLVSAVGAAGRVGGFSSVGACTACFWDIDTSGWGTSSCGTGRNTPVMKTQANYTAAGWDFAHIWAIDPAINDGYPYLRWLALVSNILVVSPNGGEAWDAGSDHTILWTHYNSPIGDVCGTHVRIELLRGGAFDEEIVASTPIGPVGGGNYLWSIAPDKAHSSVYQVRISSTTAPITDTSDKEFTIRNLTPKVAVATLPATGVG